MVALKALLLLLGLLLLLSYHATAALHFRPDGTFTILHISDVHFVDPVNTTTGACPGSRCRCYDLSSEQLPYPCSGANTTALIRRLVATEQPDLVAFQGDLMDGRCLDPEYCLGEVLSTAGGTPFAYILGNHDPFSVAAGPAGIGTRHCAGAPGSCRRQVMEMGASYGHGSLAQLGPPGIHGFGNYLLEVANNNASLEVGLQLFFFDSGSDNDGYNERVPGYDYVWPEQVNWFEQQVKGDGVPALAFMHIPTQEWAEAVAAPGANVTGSHFDGISPSTVNGGLYAGFLNPESGVKAAFCGHDHTNDFCVPYNGVQLCYEGAVGYQAYGKSGYGRRARVTQVRGFGTSIVSWKRLDDGSVVDEQVLWEKKV